MSFRLASEEKRRSRRSMLRALQSSGRIGGLPDPVQMAKDEGLAFGDALSRKMDEDLLAQRRANPSLAFDLKAYLDGCRALGETVRVAALAKRSAGLPVGDCSHFEAAAKATIAIRAKHIIGSMVEGLREDGPLDEDYTGLLEALPELIFPTSAPI